MSGGRRDRSAAAWAAQWAARSAGSMPGRDRLTLRLGQLMPGA